MPMTTERLREIADYMCLRGLVLQSSELRAHADELAALREDRDSLAAQLDTAETALKALYVELSKLTKVAQAPISTVGRMKRMEARRDAAMSEGGGTNDSTPKTAL